MDTAPDRRALVAGEVESPGVTYEAEQFLELFVVAGSRPLGRQPGDVRHPLFASGDPA